MNDNRVAVACEVDREYERDVDDQLLAAAVQAAFLVALADGAGEAFPLLAGGKQLEVGLRVTDDEEMRRLNVRYRRIDRPTDVLSFSFLEGNVEVVTAPDAPLHLGDIAISYPRVRSQAAELGHSAAKELAWLTIHGMLQILGYTHDVEEAAEHMEDLEHRALADMHPPPD